MANAYAMEMSDSAMADLDARVTPGYDARHVGSGRGSVSPSSSAAALDAAKQHSNSPLVAMVAINETAGAGDGLKSKRHGRKHPGGDGKGGQGSGHSGKPAFTSSSYRGVSWHGPSKQWRATIFANQKPRHLAYFFNEVDAARAYDLAAVQLRTAAGASRFLNFPEDIDLYQSKLDAGETMLNMEALSKPAPKTAAQCGHSAAPSSPKAKGRAAAAAAAKNSSLPPLHNPRSSSKRESADGRTAAANGSRFIDPLDDQRNWASLPETLLNSSRKQRQTRYGGNPASQYAQPTCLSLQLANPELIGQEMMLPDYTKCLSEPLYPVGPSSMSASFSFPQCPVVKTEQGLGMVKQEHGGSGVRHQHAFMRPLVQQHAPLGYGNMEGLPWDMRPLHHSAHHSSEPMSASDLRMASLDDSLAQLHELMGSDHDEEMM